MIKRVISAMVFALFFNAGISESTEWLNLLETNEGVRCYIDIESIKRTSDSTMTVVRKIETDKDKLQEVSSRVTSLEIDCEGKRIKSLGETMNFTDGHSKQIQGNHQFIPVGPEDIDESLLEFVCSLKKVR